MWEPLIAVLGEDHRVLVPDLRGFGRSDAPDGDYSKHALAADVLALLDREGIERAAVVGHDWGGWIAWLLALEHPGRVERFVSLDVPPPSSHQSSLWRLPAQLLFGSYQYVIATPWLGERLVSTPSAVRAFIRAGSGPRHRWSDDELDQYATPLSEPARARASVSLYRTFLLHELPALIRGTYTSETLEVPGLAIMGEASAITKAFGVPDQRPNLDVEVIPDAGHYLVDEAADAVFVRLRSSLG
jgi:pimeloyl-ACP methyl ester carboxylesterase